MNRVQKGRSVPDLKGNALSGNLVKLQDYKDSPLILSFYRYAGCQFCNLRMHDFIKYYRKEYEPNGVKAIAVFQSPMRKMKKYTKEHNATFEIISDPKYFWYDAFGLENSWKGFVNTATKPKQFIRSVALGFMRIDPDGSMNRMPADFLINAGGTVDHAYYGKDLGDHIPFQQISSWIKSL